jgi:hypothetical protein
VYHVLQSVVATSSRDRVEPLSREGGRSTSRESLLSLRLLLAAYLSATIRNDYKNRDVPAYRRSLTGLHPSPATFRCLFLFNPHLLLLLLLSPRPHRSSVRPTRRITARSSRHCTSANASRTTRLHRTPLRRSRQRPELGKRELVVSRFLTLLPLY